MSIAAEQFKRKLDGENLRYDYFPKEEERKECIKIGFSGRNFNGIYMYFIFDDDGRTLNIKVYDIAKANEDNLMPVYVKVNELNQKWRWVTFFLNDENQVTVSGDAIVDEETAGDECFEILERYVDIIDESYPEIMKTIWA